ncbi:hypothetical protein F8M41_024810 [Gigaspora margarita]|uniref:Uncharacterized protein n=1 Tax=Gigaspora margarita TaxID=4874 RepID=A0A8H4B0F5_GIGMA|nr:hypothetical protein F8M41_024810 [Gigaspora margarita]
MQKIIVPLQRNLNNKDLKKEIVYQWSDNLLDEINSLVFDPRGETENNKPGLEDNLDGEIDKIANNLESSYSNKSNKDNEVYNEIFNEIDKNEVNELEFEENKIDEIQ